MRIIGNLITDLKGIPAKVREAEAIGYDAAFTAEINNDPFLPQVLASEHSERIELMTSIAVAFARNPMTLANTAHDLNEYCGGRFVLGIGSQIEPHITRRHSMPWSKPASRMREFILAMRAIWQCWNEGTPLAFEGEFYHHTLMTPMFVPASREHGPPKVKLAAVGPRMTEVAAEIADGMIAHGFTTQRYLREVTLPAVERGLRTGGRKRDDFDICCPVVVVSGVDEQAFAQSKAAATMQLAFYASTPAYRAVLELHGWGDLQPEATLMSKRGQWLEMSALIDDEILNELAVVCEDLADVPRELDRRYRGLVDSWQCTLDVGDADRQRLLVDGVRLQQM